MWYHAWRPHRDHDGEGTQGDTGTQNQARVKGQQDHKKGKPFRRSEAGRTGKVPEAPCKAVQGRGFTMDSAASPGSRTAGSWDTGQEARAGPGLGPPPRLQVRVPTLTGGKDHSQLRGLQCS